MSGGVGRAALLGATTAVAVVLIAVLGYWAWATAQQESEAVSELLVICTAPDEDGGEVAAIAFVIDVAGRDFRVLDTTASSAVPGTSANSAREAFPFGGGDVVAGVLASQTGGSPLEWVVVAGPVWSEIVDKAGGLSVEIPVGLSSYTQGRLTHIEAGRRDLSGAELVAVAASTDYLLAKGEAEGVLGDIASGLGTIIAADPGLLTQMAASGRADTSVDLERLPSVTN